MCHGCCACTLVGAIYGAAAAAGFIFVVAAAQAWGRWFWDRVACGPARSRTSG